MVSGVGHLTFTGLVFSWFFANWEKKWIKDWSNDSMLYKTMARLLYKLRCEDYFPQVKPHQSMHPTHAVAQT